MMNAKAARRLMRSALICILAAPLNAPGAAASWGAPAGRFERGIGPERMSGSLFGWLHQPAPPPARPPMLRRQRKSTIGIGLQGSYGVVGGSSKLASGFDHGPGYAFRVRYMVSSRAALGFSFENQNFGSVLDYVPEDTVTKPDTTLQMTTVGMEGVLYFHRERETNPYLLAGFGYASPDVVFRDQGARRTNEGPYLTIGAGLEHFLRPRVALDFTLRGYAQVGNSELTSFAQLNGGLHLYPGD